MDESYQFKNNYNSVEYLYFSYPLLERLGDAVGQLSVGKREFKRVFHYVNNALGENKMMSY